MYYFVFLSIFGEIVVAFVLDQRLLYCIFLELGYTLMA